MFKIIQSNDPNKLAQRLVDAYQEHSCDIFDQFVVIVPAKVLGEWLNQTIAKTLGVSSSLMAQFWGQYQWQLIAKVLQAEAAYLTKLGKRQQILSVPETALLSASVIRWRLFAYLIDEQASILADQNHALYPLLLPLTQDERTISTQILWGFCDDLARLFVGYLTERNDWLRLWANNQSVDVMALIAQKDAISQLYDDGEFLSQKTDANDVNHNTDAVDRTQTPDWLQVYYEELQASLKYLWFHLFAGVYQHRCLLEERFWQILEDEHHPLFCQKNTLLPRCLYLFTVQQLPQIELDFLQRLSIHTDIQLFHFNPSMMFWADIVDKRWLSTQKIINPNQVYLKEHGHGLLSRLGKSSRETFAMLAMMSGGEDYDGYQVIWEDIFNETLANRAPKTLLEYLKADILMLQESSLAAQTHGHTQGIEVDFVLSPQDDSLIIHNCHSLKRQLEVARLLIGRWLNQPSRHGKQRQLSDIAVMLPDIQSNHDLIRSVFVEGVGIDGLTLPAKITGVVDESTHELWAAILGIYQLPTGRLYFDEFCEWLMLSYVHRAFGMSFEMARRACELLELAGFVRGLDETHIKQNLHDKDYDFRRTLGFAIDRLTLSLAMGEQMLSEVLYPFEWHEAQVIEKTQTLAGVGLDDQIIIQALCRIYLAFVRVRGQYEQKNTITHWLTRIENEVINTYFYEFHDTQNQKSIFDAMNGMRASVRANKAAQLDNSTDIENTDLRLALKFVLDALSATIFAQQIAAEPSGVITFGRFGSLRGIGFGLVIMLGMNLSEFPRTEPINRLDLKKAGLPRRGDRISEDDDNGAFLEAILQAGEHCWIFYDGQNYENKKQLPASPITELIAYLKSVQWQGEANDVVESWLIKNHTPTPFHSDNFEINDAYNNHLTPAPIWQGVYETMQADHKNTKTQVIDLPNHEDMASIMSVLEGPCDLSGDVHITSVIAAIKFPAKTYLVDKILMSDDEDRPINEPLQLTKLDEYKLNQSLIEQNTQFLLYDTLLPAGISRQKVLDETQEQILDITNSYHEYLSKEGVLQKNKELVNKIIVVDTQTGQSKIYATLPKENTLLDQGAWYQLMMKKLTAESCVECYLLHLCWQITLGLSDLQQNDHITKKSLTQTNELSSSNNLLLEDFSINGYCSKWCFFAYEKKQVLIFPPMNKNDAYNELILWINFYSITKKYPICLTPTNVECYWNNKSDLINDDGFDAKKAKSVFKEWLEEPYNSFVSKNSSHNKYWQYILGSKNSLKSLISVLPIADRLYANMFKYANIIDVD